jgi:hypothetical protein
MRRAFGMMAVTALLLSAAPARADRHWHCEVSERIDGSFVMLWQAYRGPGRPMDEPLQQIVPDSERRSVEVRFSMNTQGTWSALDAPFVPPSRVSLSIQLPDRPASRAITLYAAGMAPIVTRAYRWPGGPGTAGVTINLRNRRQALALLTNRDWTAIVHFRDGRVQYVVPFRMPMDVERLRALRERQVPLMRALARDPAALCQPHDERDR